MLVDVLTHSKEPDVEVFRPRIHSRIVRREYRALVIAEDRDRRGRLFDHVAVDEDVTKQKPFVAAEGKSNELGFVSGCRRDRLHLALPHDKVAVEEVAEASDALTLSLPGVGVVGVGEAAEHAELWSFARRNVVDVLLHRRCRTSRVDELVVHRSSHVPQGPFEPRDGQKLRGVHGA